MRTIFNANQYIGQKMPDNIQYVLKQTTVVERITATLDNEECSHNTVNAIVAGRAPMSSKYTAVIQSLFETGFEKIEALIKALQETQAKFQYPTETTQNQAA